MFLRLIIFFAAVALLSVCSSANENIIKPRPPIATINYSSAHRHRPIPSVHHCFIGDISGRITHSRRVVETTTICIACKTVFHRKRRNFEVAATMLRSIPFDDDDGEKGDTTTDEGSPEVVPVGSQEYYRGFLSRNLDEDVKRVSGESVIGPTLKFAGGAGIILVLLTIGFLSSNDIIWEYR